MLRAELPRAAASLRCSCTYLLYPFSLVSPFFRSSLLLALALALCAPRCFARDSYFGADLSYANEMDDHGAKFRDGGAPRDVFKIFKSSGHNLVRIRLWNDAAWTKYSNFDDVVRSLRRAKAAGLPVLLDFHYSDDWADGDKQLVPKAWENLSPDELASELYKYTYATLAALSAKGLMPDLVQVGNETNRELMGDKAGQPPDPARRIDWARNAKLFNAGIRAVRDAGAKAGKMPRIMLHIAQPENARWWFREAGAAGIAGYDIIGLSYYKRWSKMDMAQLGEVIRQLRSMYPDKDVVVAETAYPFTRESRDEHHNLLGDDSAFPAYGVSPEGQARYMLDLAQLVSDSGGSGVIYWAPDWVSTKARTRWGAGSAWENATFFDFEGNALPALRWPEEARGESSK